MKKAPKVVNPNVKLDKCPDCKVKAGNVHKSGCDIERCSVCGGQYISCECDTEKRGKHDATFSRWTGFWPGSLESRALNMDLNSFYITGMHKIFFVKPTQ